MNARLPFVAWVAVAGGFATAAEPSPKEIGLCLPQETVYFACPVSQGRWISLCGAAPRALQYRFGRPGAAEMTFPKSPADGAGALLYTHYARYQVERVEVRFENGGVDYAVFDHQQSTTRRAGVRVTTSNGKEHEVACTRAASSRLGELRKLLRCDSDSALNLGACP